MRQHKIIRIWLRDLANYDFIDGLSTTLLDQVSIDGSVYALLVNNVMYGIYYNKTLMEEHGWELPANFAELEALCAESKEAGLEPGYIGAQLTGVPFATVFNLTKTGWFSTLDGVNWERNFLAGNAIKLLSLLFSAEGQAAFITEQTPCVLSVLNNASLPEDALIYDAQQALWDGRAFLMTYVGWENVLADIGQAYKSWFRGEDGMDGPGCIARMDELQTAYLNDLDSVYFCESTADFTLEETARLVGKALGSAVGADAVLIAMNEDNSRPELRAGLTGKLYAGPINSDVASTITFGSTREYAIMTMTGAQVRELAETGFDAAGDGKTYPYVLVARGDAPLEDDETYQIAFTANSYTEETGQTYNVQVDEGSLSTFVRAWLEEQGTVSPDGNPWE